MMPNKHRQDAIKPCPFKRMKDAEFAITGGELAGIPIELAKKIVTLKKWVQEAHHAYEAGKADANALPDLPDKLCWSLSGPFKGEAGPVYRFCHDNFTGGNVNQGCGYGPTLYEAAQEAIKQIDKGA